MNLFVEGTPTRPKYIYPLNSGYHYPNDDEYYDDNSDQEPTVIENIKNNLPWPLNMVGRMGKGPNSKDENNEYPDSIQSILKNIDQSDAEKHNQYVEYHSEYPFLNEEESVFNNQQRENMYNPYEEPQYNIYKKNDYQNKI